MTPYALLHLCMSVYLSICLCIPTSDTSTSKTALHPSPTAATPLSPTSSKKPSTSSNPSYSPQSPSTPGTAANKTPLSPSTQRTSTPKESSVSSANSFTMTWGGSDALWSASPSAGKRPPTKPSTAARHGKRAAQRMARTRESPLRSPSLSPTTAAEKGQKEREYETISEGVYPDRETIALTSCIPSGASPAKNGTASEEGREFVARDNVGSSGREELFDVQLSDPAVGVREAAGGNVEKDTEEEVKSGVGEKSKMNKSAMNTFKEEPREELDGDGGDAHSAVIQQGVGVYSEIEGLMSGSVVLPVRHSAVTQIAPVQNAEGGEDRGRGGEREEDSGGRVKGDAGSEEGQEEELDIISLNSPDDRRGGPTSPTPAISPSSDPLPVTHPPSHLSPPPPAAPIHTPPHLPQVDPNPSLLTTALLEDGGTETGSDFSPHNLPLSEGRGEVLSGIGLSSQTTGLCSSATRDVAAAEPLKDQLSSSQHPSLPRLSSPSPPPPPSPSPPLPPAILGSQNKTKGHLSSFLEEKSETNSGREFVTRERGNSPEDGAVRQEEKREGLEAGHQSMKIRVMSNESGSSIVRTKGEGGGGGGGGGNGGGGRGKEGEVETRRGTEKGTTLRGREKEEEEEEGGEKEADRVKEGWQVVVGVGGDRDGGGAKNDVRLVEKGVEEAAILQVGAWYLHY